ncbi:MAG TPA: UvrB/UvrC motif-containing protein [Gemmatimonadaceae bacterium]|nr:UvrB/UvrC motif-containing protein [Gemmatimonadaceae bacterium]
MRRRARPPTPEAQLAALRAHIRSTCENRPGVYRMLADDGEVLYVGKSKRVRSRLLSYFRCEFPAEKGARIVREARSVEWEYVPSEFAALLQEMHLIKRLRPRFNVAMKRDGRNLAFIKLVRGAAPKLLVVRTAADDSATYYGPFHGAQRVGESLRELSDVLGLRDCALDQPMHFADQRELFTIFPRTPGCIRLEVRKCLGPCAGGCTEREYASRVTLARAFLDGWDDGPIDTLRSEMHRASEDLAFERAASLRDKVQRLEGLRAQFARLRFALDTLSFVYTVPGWSGDDRVYLIRRGRVRAEDVPPTAPRDRRRLDRLRDAVFGRTERESSQVPWHEIDELLLVSSWFRRNPDEMARTEAV